MRGRFAVGVCLDARGDAAMLQSSAEPVSIVILGSEKRLGPREGIDHQVIRHSALGRQIVKDPIERAQTAPADEAVLDDLAWAITGWRITPAQPVPDHEDHVAYDPTVIDLRNAVRQVGNRTRSGGSAPHEATRP